MRSIAVLGLILLLPACDYVGNPFDGFGKFTGDTISFKSNPNNPAADGENMRRVRGQEPDLTPLTPEGGNIWPGPPPPEPTLSDIQREQNEGTTPPATGQTVPRPVSPPGSSTPPPGQPQTMPPLPAPPTAQSPATPITPPAIRNDAVVQTPQGPATIQNRGGSPTFTMPNGSTGTVIDNGNGTMTLVNPNGTVQSVPAPR